MYYKDIRVWVPNEEILGVVFFKHHEFFVFNFLNKPYIIAAKVTNSINFIGFGADGKIYLLDRENNREIYASSALAVFARQLKLYRDLVNEKEHPAIEQNDENMPKKSTFSEQIKKLDENALSDEDNFWPEVIRKMHIEGLI